jgi:outer membrane immunogenic protein
MGEVMRVALVGLALLGIVSEASAADLGDVIRGSTPYEPGVPSYFRWEGVYAGGQIGYGSARPDLGNGVSSLVSFLDRNTIDEAEMRISSWTTLQNQNRSGQSYGVFAGYNSQWDDVVLGVELNYNRTSFALSDSSSIARVQRLSDGNNHNVRVDASAGLDLTEYGTLRGRAGYVMGRFLPYATLGVAVGRATVTQSATLSGSVTTTAGSGVPGVGVPTGSAAVAKTAFPWGFEAGAGVDIAVLPGVMVRAEYEFIQFSTFNDMRAMMQTVRLGAGVKF